LEVSQVETVELTTAAAPRPSLLDRLKPVVAVLGLVVASLTALLPARLAYWVACRRGDWSFRHQSERSVIVKRSLLQVFGDTLSPAEAERLAREFSRAESCEVIDIMRLRNGARPLRKLVEFRGREHLEAAMAAGNGAILCSAHFGSYRSAFSLIHASGIPVTSIGLWWWNYDPYASPAVRRFWDFAYARRTLRYRQGPSIESWECVASGRSEQAVSTLRRNEVVTILSDSDPQVSDESRVVKVPFLGREATFLPGVIHLARSSGAPVLVVSVHRSADYRHQVVEISPPISMEGELQEALARCAAVMDAAIRTNPAQWGDWSDTGALASLGLIPATTSPRNAVVA
jgi:Kdo2-lipid IVA lauroyltransferase/acyltransferase